MDKILFGLCVGYIINLAFGQLTFEVDNKAPKAGDTVIFKCTVVGKTPLDYVKTFRKINGVVHEIATNHYPKDAFKNSGRYNMAFRGDAVADTSIFTLTITDLQGMDSGEIGCEWVKTPDSEFASEMLKVQVPPTSVKLFKYNPDTEEETEVENDISMISGKNDGFGCRVNMQDYTGDDPTIGLKIGDQMLQAPTMAVGPKVTNEDGFQRVSYSLAAKHVTDASQRSDSNKVISCQVKVGETVISEAPATAKLTVKYGPTFSCNRKPRAASKDSTEFELSCAADMYPAPTEYSWTWTSGDDSSVSVTPDDDNAEFTADQQSKENNRYKFTLKFTNVDLEDFHDYTLKVMNEVGMDEHTFTVEEQIETTMSPKDTPKPNGNGKPVNPGPTYVHKGNGETGDGKGNSAASPKHSLLIISSIIIKYFYDHL